MNINSCQTDNMHSGKSSAVKLSWSQLYKTGLKSRIKAGWLTLPFWTSRKLPTHPHELLKCKLYGYGIGGKTEIDRFFSL